MEGPPSAASRRIGLMITVAAVVSLFASCGGLVIFGDYPKNGIRVERLEADLNEQLPDGSSWEQAEAWFASHDFQPHLIAEKDGPIVGLGATVPNDSLLESAEIRIEVYFSPDGRLKERVIYRFVYSL
jgi:hypothetical protein